jgi:low affinity Fe/Cu permease
MLWQDMQSIQHLLTRLGVITSRPWAFALVSAYGLLWCIFDRQSLDWHGFATLATLLMTLLIQRAEHRDTQAIHAKLDELLHAESRASNHPTKLDKEEPEVIEKHRNRARHGD